VPGDADEALVAPGIRGSPLMLLGHILLLLGVAGLAPIFVGVGTWVRSARTAVQPATRPRPLRRKPVPQAPADLALVPVNRETTFAPDVSWFSFYDPLDPVSGKQLAFQKQPPECCPQAPDIGYAASWWLLLAHLKYLTMRKPATNLAMLATQWLLTDDAGYLNNRPVTGWALGTWFPPGSIVEKCRGILAWLTWTVVTVALALLGAIVLPVIWHAVVAAFWEIWSKVLDETVGRPSP
jgi:hypothetical protein